MRYFIQFSYFGKPYHGWQKQLNAITVQQVLDEALSTLLGHPIATIGAGRTDAGVHARQMFAHFEAVGPLNSSIPKLIYRLNAYLPVAIAVQCIFKVPEEAHARFDAIERTYEYWIVQEKNPFYSDYAHYVRHPLNLPAMNQAAALLLDYEDFECFSRTKTDVKTYRCDVKKAVWITCDDKLVFTITADRFLRNMVRAVVGTLLLVGQDKWTIADVKRILNAKDRSLAGPSVPAKGLYLTSVLYPQKILGKHG
ncbi:tRNA pseudouridine(38-40) synthase TruA [Pricia sp. S334]|uniref:tRNA pseudouridine synthase A n=1 Tax=Pricia mediterranea TaxID=3076079 RepID=A0ABU3L1W2_9FLAO|nr:tRNA pseudouridine(38-40) synthase TruA [Pricia sp. S334]MDT7827707.1 tRNA pseudouridine(38-40) synthase TruA [Pricia sp. S334]